MTGYRAVAMSMLPPTPPTKPLLKGEERVTGSSGLRLAVTHDLLSGMPLVLFKKELIRLWNSILPEPEQPSAHPNSYASLHPRKPSVQ